MWRIYLPFMPLIASIFTGFVGYFLGIRGKKRDRFLNMAEDNLKEFYSPIYHEIHLILASQHITDRKILIDDFFKKYMSSSTPIYRIGNSFLLDWFYEMEKAYSLFLSERTIGNWSKFWRMFLSFYQMMESNYRNIHFTVFRDVQWKEYLSRKNMFFSLLIEIVGLLYEAIAFLTVAAFISILLGLYGVLVGIPGCNKTVLMWLVIAFLATILLLSFLIVIAHSYLMYKTPSRMNDNSLLTRLIEKIFHMDTWEEWLAKKYPDEVVPEMPTEMDDS